ncbi:hypothetical protein DVH05_020274 [Phytophthora capsici]|nr:hypothetical protein DVH05_020274 [Phytophthora capsici]|eukprot:jgi/Phyca11/113678/e_gw1.24.344.1
MNRLERYAALNEIVQEKNQAENGKTSNQDTNHKRKKKALDNSVPFSSLSWDEIEPVLQLNMFHLTAKPVPDEFVRKILAQLADLHQLYGDVSTGKEEKRKMFTMTVLEAVCLHLGDVMIFVDEELTGTKIHMHGSIEFVLQRGAKRVPIVIARRDNVEQGMAQCVACVEVLADAEGLERTFGIVTNYLHWIFIRDEDESIELIDQPLNASMPSFESLKVILGMICGMLESE